MPRPKVNKVLAYRKCQQCRKDRQKCSPEGRSWPGRRCDRCQRYDYACSANRTKNEEIALSNSGNFTRHDAGSGARKPSYSPEIPSLLQGDAQSEARETSFSPELRFLPQGDAQSEARETSFSPELRFLPQGDAQSEVRETSFSPVLRSLPQVDAEFEAQYLQKLGDYYQILKTGENLQFLPYSHFIESTMRGMIDDCVKTITIEARIHQAQGRYKDAEYLFRQLGAASAPIHPSEDSLLKPEPDMVLIYEKLGNLPAAEILQEHRLRLLMSREHGSADAIISREAENLFRLYILFLARSEDLDVFTSTTSALLMVFYRIAILGCSLLNALLFQSELWTRCNPEECLHIAIRIQSTEMIRGLISIGVDINESGDEWSPPLLTAARYGNLDTLKLLLENNIDIGAKSPYNATALHIAMYRDAKQRDKICEIICRLIEAGVDINALDCRSHTALHSAVVHDPEPEEKVVCCLIEAGVDIEAEDRNRETALKLAVRRGYLTTVRLLLQQGANTEGCGGLGETPLLCAVRYADESMAELLLDHGANIEAQNRESKNPPLHLAVLYRRIEMVRLLLGRGASVAACNRYGQKPVYIARFNGDQNLVDMLLEYEK